MESSTTTLARKAAIRREVVRKCATEECMEGWLVCAEQVLTQKKVHPVVYVSTLRGLPVKGQGKQKYNDCGI